MEERVSELEAQVEELQREMALLKAEEIDMQSFMSVGEEALRDKAAPTSMVEEEPIVEAKVEEHPMEPVIETTAVEPEIEAAAEEKQEATVAEPIDFQPMGRMQPALPRSAGNAAATEELNPAGKSLESKIGKMLIPLAGSALIIFALVLFGSLIQPRLTDTMKAILMTVVSAGIAGVGIWRMHRSDRFRTLFAALAGCGSAGLYVTLLVSHLVLGVLPEMPLMVCVVLWIAAMTALSKYKSRMFCFICYIGILVSAYMTVQRWGGSPVGLIVYMISVGALFATNCTRRYKQDAWLLWQYPLVMLPMADNYDSSTLAQLLIFLSTAAVLAGQVIYYHRQIRQRLLLAVPTLLTLFVLMWSATQFQYRENANLLNLNYYFDSKPLFDNPVAWSLLLSATLIGLSVLYYKYFDSSLLKNRKALFYLMGGFTALVIPALNFGTFYHGWCGAFCIPALLALGLGCYYNKEKLRYLGYVYLFLYTCSYADRLSIPYEVSEQTGSEPFEQVQVYMHLQSGIFLYLATLVGFGYWLWRRCAQLEKGILLCGLAWGICELCICNWLDSELTCLLLFAYCMTLTFKPEIVTGADLKTKRAWDGILGLSVLLAVAVVPLRIYLLFVSSASDHLAALLAIPNRYGGPVIGLAAGVMLWLEAHHKRNDVVKVVAYILLAINLMFSMFFDKLSVRMAFWGVYLLPVLGCAYWTWRHYNRTDKLGLTALGLCFICALGACDLLGGTEVWALCSLFVIACGVLRFAIDPQTGTLDSGCNKICMIAHEFLLLVGTGLLRESPEPLYFIHSQEGTEPYSTALLVVVVLMLALINLRRVNSLMRYLPEKGVSLYNGLKFTWTLGVILWRFSAVSYLISLAGIVLAIAFIVAGFRFSYKGLRLYGLVLTMVCVIKLLFFDIVFDNAFYRPISFLVAGILLFLISYIYFRLEKNTSVLQDKSK